MVSNDRIGNALIQRGLLPASCVVIDLHIDVRGALKIRYEKLVDVDELAAVADALREVAAAIKAEKP